VVRRGGREFLAVSLDERRSVLRGLHELGPVTVSSRSSTVTAHVRLQPREPINSQLRPEPVAARQ
jgi:hypothetical protein